MKRFDIITSCVMGLALPLLETLRRRTDFSDFLFYVDDYLAGGLLLWAAFATHNKRPYGPALLAAAWGVLCGGLYMSFFGQMMILAEPDPSGLPSVVVVIIKGFLFAFSLFMMFRIVWIVKSET